MYPIAPRIKYYLDTTEITREEYIKILEWKQAAEDGKPTDKNQYLKNCVIRRSIKLF